MTLRQVGDILNAASGLAWSFVQQGEYCEEYIAKPGSAGADDVLAIRRYTAFRVYLNDGTKCADVSKPSLLDALREAFETISLPLPAEFQERSNP